MKYYILFRGERADGSPAAAVYDTPEAAFADIPGRAKRFGNSVGDYAVLCQSDSAGPSVILTTPPVNGTVQLNHNVSSANPKQAYGDKKPPLHLVPPILTIRAAIAMGEGSRRYGAYNWRAKKVEVMTYVGAILRHVAAWADGEEIDPESQEEKHHLDGAAASLAILLDAIYGGFAVDNRPPKGPAAEAIRNPKGSKK